MVHPAHRRRDAAVARLQQRAKNLAESWSMCEREHVINALFNAVSLKRAALAAMIPLYLDPDENTEFVEILARRAVERR